MNGAIEVWVCSPPGDAAPLHVDALAHDVRVEVGGLPATEVDLALRRAVQNDVVANLLDGHAAKVTARAGATAARS